MKKLSITKKHKTMVVCDNGSTFYIDYPHNKNHIYLTTDLTNNPAFISPLEDLNLDTFKKTPSKQKVLHFDFLSLLKKEGGK